MTVLRYCKLSLLLPFVFPFLCLPILFVVKTENDLIFHMIFAPLLGLVLGGLQYLLFIILVSQMLQNKDERWLLRKAWSLPVFYMPFAITIMHLFSLLFDARYSLEKILNVTVSTLIYGIPLCYFYVALGYLGYFLLIKTVGLKEK